MKIAGLEGLNEALKKMGLEMNAQTGGNMRAYTTASISTNSQLPIISLDGSKIQFINERTFLSSVRQTEFSMKVKLFV